MEQNVTDNKIGDEATTTISELLMNNTTLTTLSLYRNEKKEYVKKKVF